MTVHEIEARRRQILDAAMDQFESGGLEAVSFRQIAASLGCSYSTPYRYFDSKEALLTALRARAFRWMEEAMEQAIAAKSGARDRLAALAEAFIQAALAHPARYALMFFELPNTDLAQRSLELIKAKREALDVCTRIVSEGQAKGELNLRVDPLTASHLFWAGAHGLVSLEVAGQFVMGRDVDTLIPSMITTLMQGLEAQPDEATTPRRGGANA